MTDDDQESYEQRQRAVAQRVSEARVELVLMLSEAGYADQRVADLVNDHFNELVRLAVAMDEWSPRLLSQAMLHRVTRDDAAPTRKARKK